MRFCGAIRHNVPVADGENGREASAVGQGPGLTPHESVPLLTAWVSRLGGDLGVRTLVIKGPLMSNQGLRPERASSDVDVWVDPSRFGELVVTLEGFGWRSVYSDERHTILPQHSATLRHERWACELDVHDRIPGFFADPGEAFELFWTRRTSGELAHAEVLTSDPVGNAAILAVNLLRAHQPGSETTDLELLADVVRAFDAEQQSAFAGVVAASGANDTVAPFLRLTGIPAAAGPSASPQELEAWRVLVTTQHAPSTEWMVALRRARPRAWPSLIWRAFWLNEAEIRLVEPQAPPGQWGLFRARCHRAWRGLKGLPAAARVVLLRRDH
jgi:hypothetical protein